jgi:hypothetical protein
MHSLILCLFFHVLHSMLDLQLWRIESNGLMAQ